MAGLRGRAQTAEPRQRDQERVSVAAGDGRPPRQPVSISQCDERSEAMRQDRRVPPHCAGISAPPVSAGAD